MGLVHNHYIVRAEVKKPFTKRKKVKKWLKRLVNSIGMKICKRGGPHVDYVDKPGNCGIAAVAMIETSHVALHVWDQEDPPLAQLDVYSCSPFDIKTVDKFLYEMDPTDIKTIFVDRDRGMNPHSLSHSHTERHIDTSPLQSD
jgi:S-adenosylmethionine/arginine decarboxylase-like enzyme